MNGLIGRFAEWLVLIVVLIGAATATLRYLFSYGSNAFLEAQWYLFGTIVLLGAAYTLNRNEHVRVDLFYGYLSRRGRLWVDTIGLVFFLLPAMIYFGMALLAACRQCVADRRDLAELRRACPAGRST